MGRGRKTQLQIYADGAGQHRTVGHENEFALYFKRGTAPIDIDNRARITLHSNIITCPESRLYSKTLAWSLPGSTLLY